MTDKWRLRKMAEHRGRIGSVLLLVCMNLCIPGCFYAYYPDTYDASDFEEFHYQLETDPPCLEPRSGSEEGLTFLARRLCEATITREADGEYIVILEGRTDDQSEPYREERAMTESEVGDMLWWFAKLNINLHPQPFCVPLTMGMDYPPGFEAVYRWDDFELVSYDCDRARLELERAWGIERFLGTLLPEDETADTL